MCQAKNQEVYSCGGSGESVPENTSLSAMAGGSFVRSPYTHEGRRKENTKRNRFHF